MGRLATPLSAAPPPSFVAGVGPAEGDKPAARVAKYIPGETVAFFLGVKNLLDQASPTTIDRDFWLNACFVVALLGTPAYLWWQRDKGKPWIVNTIVATAAFPLWALALDWKYGWLAGFPQVLAGIFILFYTFAVGAINPAK